MDETSGHSSPRDAAPPPPAAPHAVRVALNVHHWDSIAFLHWPFDPGDVARVLPEGLTVLTHGGAAWVGVTPFFIRVRPPFAPVPPGCAFPETNLRTYVAGPDGRQGLWFLHMEVTAAWFVAALRTIGLPYHRRRMAVRCDGDLVRYQSRPKAGEQGGHDIAVRPGVPLQPPVGNAFERFLTARWQAYHRRGLLLRTPVEHPPWSLRHADVETCEVEGLFAHAGLPAPTGAPVAHWSPGVTVRVAAARPAR